MGGPRALALLAMLATALAATGCGAQEPATPPMAGEEELETIDAGVLTVGLDAPFEPFEGGRPPDYSGFDVDLVTEIAERLDLELRIEDSRFDTIFRELVRDKLDLVASAATITRERERKVAFSDPYFEADQSLMVAEGSDIRSVDGLTGQTVGAQRGTTGAAFAEDETAAETVRTYAEIDDAFDALAEGEVAAVVNDLAVSELAEQSQPNLLVVETLATKERYGIAVNQDSTRLLAAVDETLSDIKQDGTFEAIYAEWFDEAPPEEILRP